MLAVTMQRARKAATASRTATRHAHPGGDARSKLARCNTLITRRWRRRAPGCDCAWPSWSRFLPLP
eukprot:14473159-Alexandrium_andersonii.AAC.1